MTKGILIIGYGSRKDGVTDILATQAARLRARRPEPVYVGYFRVNRPSIEEALAAMADDGIDEAVVLPYLIAAGRLTDELIPPRLGLMGRSGTVQVHGRDLLLHCGQAFDRTEALTDILCDRIAECGGTRDSGLIVLGHGSRQTANPETVALNAARLRRRGYRHVEYAFNEFCAPSIAEAKERLLATGVGDLVALPLFIAVGVHLGEEIPAQLGIPPYTNEGMVEANGRAVPLRYARPVEDDPRLLDCLAAQVASFYEA